MKCRGIEKHVTQIRRRVVGAGRECMMEMVILLQRHPMFLLIEMVAGRMKNYREHNRCQKEKREQRRQERGQDREPKQPAIAKGDGDGRLE